MAYTVTDGSILQAVIEGRHENQQVMSIFTWKVQVDGSLANGATALDAFWARLDGGGRFLDFYTQCLSQNVLTIRTRLQWIYPTRFAFITRVSPDFPTGNVAGAAMPVNTAVAITKRTENAGRTQVGTLHMPGVPATAIVNGAVQAAAIARYETFGNFMLLPIVTTVPAATYTPILYHKTSPSVAQPLANFEVSRFARVQRRRTVGVGS